MSSNSLAPSLRAHPSTLPLETKTPDDLLVLVAVVGRPHGLRGEVRLHMVNAESDVLTRLHEVRVRAGDGKFDLLAVHSCRIAPASCVARLGSCSTREDASSLCHRGVYVPRSILPEVSNADEYYHVDLIGLEVRDRVGRTVGHVRRVETYPTVECLVIAVDEATQELPFLERYVAAVRTEEGYLELTEAGAAALEGE